ncbi:hypothetical protein ACQ86N_24970 [Puia sp. P3]|uniref:hypothetical protein n=1 Tax=Puia sp. P3 TaxID=3423952 RepID=UPI003D66D478
MQGLLGAHSAEMARLIGIRTAEMHLALAEGVGLKDFRPEPFSLHYQRSLFSSMTSLVRETYQNLSRNKQVLPADMQERIDRIMAYRPELLATLKKIYVKKMDALKIRIHGNYHLGQVLLTGKDLAINDFSGDPSYSYSERRPRRSPFVDIASMVLSFYEVAYDGFWHSTQLHEENVRRLIPMAGVWAYYNSGFFIEGYKSKMLGSPIMPSVDADFETMLQYYIVQRAMVVFNRYMKEDPRRLVIPQAILRKVLSPLPEVAGASAGER